MLRRPWFWILFAVGSVGCSLLAFRIFPRAFPIVSLDIAMDRAHAIRDARALALAHRWGPDEGVRDAASFGGSQLAQSFVELEGGGKPAFAALLRDELYSPYTWDVRLFKESETHQVIVRFNPGGQPCGFDETLREQAPGAALDAVAAQGIAERAAAAAPWHLPLARFALVEKSQVVRPGGRIDHHFVYERPERPIGEGRLRLELVVSGDRLTGLAHFIKIPEAFSRRFEALRSANQAVAGGASVAMVLLYLVGGCGVGLTFLIRQRAVQWRAPLVWAGIIGGLQLAAGLNAWPLAWLGYDTALSRSGWITEQLVGLLTNTLVMSFVFFVSFLVAEGLSRRAFPQHPQLWKLWSRDAAPTHAVLGRTLAGYLLAAVAIVYVSVFYYLAFRRLGWWTPSDALVNPDSLAHYWPWLTPIAQAAQAGFWEEALFRAVPLAGAALLGARFGGRRAWIAGAFLLQALVFSSAHANYPGLPAYSRVVELLVPSFVFGALYLRFGLFPSVVLHFVYDVVLMALPLFNATADGVWFDRAMVVLLALVPLWIVLFRHGPRGSWGELPAALRNSGWQPAAAPAVDQVAAPPSAAATSSGFGPRLQLAVLCAGVAGLVAWWFATPLQPLDSPLVIDRAGAIAAARAELARREVALPPTHRVDASVPDRPWETDRFAWQTAGADGYRALTGTYLPPARWAVRFANFVGDVAERAEEWTVVVGGDGRILRVQHKLPEARAGASLSEADARLHAHAALRKQWRVDPAALTEVTATSAKRPERVDWTFVWKDPAVTSLAPGEARLEVRVAGDEVTDAARFVFVPEEWQRADRARQSIFGIGRLLKGVVTGVLVLAGLGVAIVAWSRRKFAVHVARAAGALSALFAAISAVNQWPAVRAGFSTARPLSLQETMAILMPAVGVLLTAGATGLLAGWAVGRLRPSRASERDAILVASGLAAAFAGGLALCSLLRADAAPPWPPLAAAGTFSPWIASLASVLPLLLLQSLALLLILGLLDHFTAGWQRRRALACLVVFLVSGLLLLPWDTVSVATWLILTVLQALIATVGYVFVLRRDPTLVPLVCGAAAAFNTLANGAARAYPGALPSAIVTSIVLIALGGWGVRFLRRYAAVPA